MPPGRPGLNKLKPRALPGMRPPHGAPPAACHAPAGPSPGIEPGDGALVALLGGLPDRAGENVALAHGFWMVLEAPGRKKMVLSLKVHFLLKCVTLGAKVPPGAPSHPWRRKMHFLLQVGPFGAMPLQNHK